MSTEKLHYPWTLTTNHPSSSYGIPVLMNRRTRKVYGPQDWVRCFGSWPLLTGLEAARRLRTLEAAHERRRHGLPGTRRPPPRDRLLRGAE
jgi:hypothetical protein